MSAQTSYSINQRIAVAGTIFDLNPYDNVSRDVETAAGIGFGLAVSRGTDEQRQVVVGGAAFLGLTVRALDREGAANTGLVSYSEKETAAIMRSGYIYAECVSGCTAGDSANYNTITGVIDSGAAGAGEVLIEGATWETSTAAGEIGVLRLSS